jgi:hypothetical protein
LVAGAAEAENLSVPRTHVAKRSTAEAAVAKNAGIGGVRFSDPSMSPGHDWKAMSEQFSPTRASVPASPQGGFSLTAGRDSPDAPFTGGLKLRF